MELRVLKNGLRVAFVPCEAESVAFGLFVASGSRHETAREAGISHFIEHMLFKGTPRRTPLAITRAIEGRGGNFNAWTSEESTAFFAHLPDEYLEEAIDIIADMYLNALIPEGEFEREKEVVIEEIRMYSDEPDSVAAENLQRSLFPSNSLGRPVAGGPETLGPMKPEDLRRHIRRHYRPDNTVAVVAGHFDTDRAMAVLERVFAAQGAHKRPAKAEFAPVDLAGNVVSEIRVAKDVQQAQLALGYRTFGIGDERKYAATVLDAILGRGMSSRLFQEVREKRGLSYDISSRMQFFQDCGMWAVAAGVDPAKADRTLATIDRELDRIRTKRVGAAELARTKEFLVGNFRLSHEKVTSKMFYCGSSLLAFGRLMPIEEQVEGIRRVSAADVQAVAQAIFAPENRAVSWVLPLAACDRRKGK